MTERRPISRTALLGRVKAFDVEAVRRGVAESPGLLTWRDERGRSFLHIICATPPTTPAQVQASVAIAGARTDIRDPKGQIAREIMGRKKDPAFRALAEGSVQPTRGGTGPAFR
jgi:hypothetical protein